MIAIYCILLLIGYCPLLSSAESGCTIGEDASVHSSNNVERYDLEQSGTRVYLDLEHPASCRGLLRNVTLCYLNVDRKKPVNKATLSLWQRINTQNGYYTYKEVMDSEIQLPLTVTNSCGIDQIVTQIANDGSVYRAKEIVCQYYCFPEDSDIIIEPDSVLGITYNEAIKYHRGQMLVNRYPQSYGICAGILELKNGEVSQVLCPVTPTNTTTKLLAQANLAIDPITCPNNITLTNGTVNYNGLSVTFTCETGFSLIGTSPQTCQPDGQWSHSPPICAVRNCSSPGTITFPTCNATSTTDNDNNISLAQRYQLLTALLIVILTIIFVIAACIVALMFVYKRYLKVPANDYSLQQPTAAPAPVTMSTLQKPLLEEPTIQSDCVYDEIPPTRLPQSTLPALPVTVVNSSGFSNPHFLPSSPPRTLSPSASNYSFDRRSEYHYVGKTPPGGMIAGISHSTSFPSLHYETSHGAFGMMAGEDDDDNEGYWEPAVVEEKLYLQLDHIKVKKIPNDELEIIDDLGKGQFSKVSKAIWHRPLPEGDLQVAIKVLSSQEENDKIRFLQEAALMGQFTHTNVLTLYGVVTNDLNTTMIVTELMEGGDLHQWLLKRKWEVPITVKPDTLLNFCRQICLGMSYLSSRKFVHRDLAARNVLVTGDNICKISDFGMSHDLLDETYYMASEGSLIPVKWTAPEALKYRKYSTASDVWSYGCVLYEIWSLGRKPFDSFKNNETIRKITSGCRLPPTPGCPKLIYEIMMKCWHPEARKRPSFNEIMLLLLREDKKLLHVPEEDASTHPQANELGADLAAGNKLYISLQSMYTTQRSN